MKIIKNKRGSPLVEEGLLLGIAAVAFSIILSLVAGIMVGIKGYYTSLFNSFGSSINDFWNQLNKVLEEIAKWLGIQ